MSSNSMLYDLLPIDVIDEIALRTPIDSIASLCRSNQRLYSKLSDRFFWINYLNHLGVNRVERDPQDKLHYLLIELAKQGNWILFKFIWEIDLGLIKENRSLGDSYQAAFKNGKHKVADKIWKINPEWKLKFGYVWGNRINKLIVDEMLTLELAAEKNDIAPYMKQLSGTSYTFLHRALSFSTSFEFIKEVIKLHGINVYDMANSMLHEGKFELVDQIIEYEQLEMPQHPDYDILETISWIEALSSSRDDSFDYIRGYQDTTDNYPRIYHRIYR